ncbi:MAG: S8 family serine peptidase [Bacteroidales bacterium]|nr:S8 family serine peptidase [Bacteroidales bacterium]MDD3384129.1 S8 family serine peptidase [Bacteroidales bacterium]MDD3812054.1 S8 family serine peptidase [Bacteroidales bacterium]MDD3872467.1 S8 family serine peptidase [Bacteroidales bacterium]MDD4812899.1 S8 family serine peptidase [Bacteroidales bacterium]
MKLILSILILALTLPLGAQTAPGKFWVQFTDKNSSPYSIDRPEEYLSTRAIQRRAQYNIPITLEDIPVNQSYIDSLTSLGAVVLNPSKWFNAVTIQTSDPDLITRIQNLGFVRQIKAARQSVESRKVEDKFQSSLSVIHATSPGTDTTALDYGLSAHQIGMLNGHVLHNQGYLGEGIVIAVLDAGFTNTHIITAFDSLRNDGRILGTRDFVKGGSVTYSEFAHGTQVLSIMAANLPGQLIGSAPKASYYLIRTENATSEYIIEEDNWVAGAEYADSVGADMINSSLGYTTFDDPATDHSYSDMNGNTSRATIAADIAASKGILVVNSAGNSGDLDWRYIGAPVDADSILAVGAVDSLGVPASFTSHGPSADGRVKPDVAGQGVRTAVAGSNGMLYRGNGTSYSAPLVCGLVACLWQSNRALPPIKIIEAVRASASQFHAPDTLVGYGLPDFGKAMFLIQGINPIQSDNEAFARVYPNPFTDQLTVEFYSPSHQDIIFEIYSLAGTRLHYEKMSTGYTSLNRFTIHAFENLAPGTYFLRVLTGNRQYVEKVVRSTKTP